MGGTLRGKSDARVTALAPLDRAGADQLSFCASARYEPMLATTRASVVLVAPEVDASKTAASAVITVAKPQEAMLAVLPRLYPARARRPGIHPSAVITVAKPQEAMLAVLPRLYPARARRPGIHPSAVIGRGASLGEGVEVGPHVHIGERARIGDRVTIDAGVVIGEGAQVGADSHLFPRVTLYPGTQLGSRVTVHAGAVLGSDGYGYVFREGQHAKITHVGRCIVEDDVEIGAGTTIDRGSIDDTVIGAGTKIDNLVQIAHNVRVGRLCLIAAQAGISGSARIEDGVVIGGQAGFQGHHTIGRGARIGGQSGVFGDVPAGETWSGYPARPHKESLRAQAALFRLAGMLKRLERLLDRSDGGGGKTS
ncbi:MAG TPA: UDP-3-O-(3-hydroxymyristoyl)glucosamine N-acyltransferase [Gemmatimonadaceae bacterium]|nr:UDP-3-O-(3-hydroxymyristoyl)glucosamine N-acyltransferase [Gemmatimonadaceae bacterium]